MNIYHYTTFDKSLSIFNSMVLRSYDLTTMIDKQEINRGARIIIDRIINIFPSYKNQPNIAASLIFLAFVINRHFMIDEDNRLHIESVLLEHKFLKEIKSEFVNKVSLYSTCFSKFDDVQYLWSNYSDSSRGIALGFDLNTLKRHTNKITFFDVIYDTTMQVERINRIIEDNITKHYRSRYDTIALAIVKELMEPICSCKNCDEFDYYLEKEYRLVTLNIANFETRYKPTIDNSNRSYVEAINKNLFRKSLSSITFGKRMNVKDVDTIKETLYHKGIKVEYRTQP